MNATNDSFSGIINTHTHNTHSVCCPIHLLPLFLMLICLLCQLQLIQLSCSSMLNVAHVGCASIEIDLNIDFIDFIDPLICIASCQHLLIKFTVWIWQNGILRCDLPEYWINNQKKKTKSVHFFSYRKRETPAGRCSCIRPSTTSQNGYSACTNSECCRNLSDVNATIIYYSH